LSLCACATGSRKQTAAQSTRTKVKLSDAVTAQGVTEPQRRRRGDDPSFVRYSRSLFVRLPGFLCVLVGDRRIRRSGSGEPRSQKQGIARYADMDQQCAYSKLTIVTTTDGPKVLRSGPSSGLKEEAVREEHGRWLAMFGVQPLWLRLVHRLQAAILNLRRRLAGGHRHWALPLAVPGGYLALGALRLPAYAACRIEGKNTASRLQISGRFSPRTVAYQHGRQFDGRGTIGWTSGDAARRYQSPLAPSTPKARHAHASREAAEK